MVGLIADVGDAAGVQTLCAIAAGATKIGRHRTVHGSKHGRFAGKNEVGFAKKTKTLGQAQHGSNLHS